MVYGNNSNGYMMGRYGKLPDPAEGFAYNKIATIETTQEAKERLLYARSVDAGPQHTSQYIKPQENESLENYIRRTGPYIEMLQDRSIQTHINGSKMFYCHKRTDQICFMCDQNNVMILQWKLNANLFEILPLKIANAIKYNSETQKFTLSLTK